MGTQTLTGLVVGEKSVTSKLPVELSDALMALKRTQEIRLNWIADDGEQAETVEKGDHMVELLTEQFAAKDKYDEKALIKLRKALTQARDRIGAIVSKAIAT